MREEYTDLTEKPDYDTITAATPYTSTGPKLFWSNEEIPLPNIGDVVRAEAIFSPQSTSEGAVTGYFKCMNYVGIYLDNGADVFGAEVSFAAPAQ